MPRKINPWPGSAKQIKIPNNPFAPPKTLAAPKPPKLGPVTTSKGREAALFMKSPAAKLQARGKLPMLGPLTIGKRPPRSSKRRQGR